VHNKRYAFAKSQRLLKPLEFQKVFDQQQKLYHRGIVVYFCENSDLSSRLGLVVAKRHFKKAVTRNYIKRRMRESFRLNQSALGKKDIILIATSKLIENEIKWPIPTILAELWQRLVAPPSLV
jgi:ribonuclease P protein component